MPLQAFLTRLIWLCMGPLLLLSAYLAIDAVREVQDQRNARAAHLVRSLAAAVDQDLDARIAALKVLASSPLADDASRWNEFYREAQGFRASFGSHVVLADLGMRMRFNTRTPFGDPLPMLPRPKGRAAAPIAMETGKPAVGDSFLGPIAKEPLVAIAVPVVREGKTTLLLLTTFETRQFQKYLDAMDPLPDWSLALVDGRGEAIARRAPTGLKPAGEVDASGRFVAKSTASSWSVVLEISRDNYRAPLVEAAVALAIGVLGATLAGVVGGTLSSRRLGRWVASLAQPTTPGTAPPGIKEIASVRRVLDEAAQHRETAEATLRQTAALYQHTLDNMLEGCQIIAFDWRYRYLNPAGALQNRQPREALIGRTMMEVYPGFEATEVFAALRRCMEQRIAQHSETEFVFPDGSRAWFDVNVQPAPEGIAIFSVDITERKRVEEVRGRQAAIIESSDDAIIGETTEGIITSWNSGAQKLFGYSCEEAIGQAVQMLVPSERSNEERETLARIARGESVDHFETVRVRRDGAHVDISATVSPIRDAQGKVVGASKIARDITDRKLAQERMQAQLERLSLLDRITSAIGERQDLQSIYQVVVRSLEDQLPVAFCCICSHDPAVSTLTVVRAGAGHTLAMDEHTRIEIDQNGLARCVRGELVYEPDIAASEFPFPRRLAQGGMRSLVAAPLRSESQVFGVLLAARGQAHAFSSGECEFLRQLSAHVALAAHQAQLYGALQLAYDELRQTQQAVMQQERLRALGQMASGIAHDINNAIAPVLLYAETLLEREGNLSERGRNQLQVIARSIDDVAATVARLREFYRHDEAQVVLLPVELNTLVTQVAELTRARWSDMPQKRGAVIRMVSELAPDLPVVRGAENEIREALINLVFNAVDAMPDGGTLTLRTGSDPGDAVAPPSAHIDVIDTGVGMNDATRQRCLEPFFTTKGERGTGLGLAMVYGIAQRHGADLHIDSAVGRGTTVRMSFPVPPIATVTSLQTTTVRAPTSRLRILIVDDDPIVLRSLRDTLEADGHAVTAVDGGQSGIDAFRAARELGDTFDAVITDLGMPHVDGRQVASAVKQDAAATPVILLTGWGQRLAAEGEMPAHVDRVVGKPPKLRELRAALAQLVGDVGNGRVT